MTGENVKTTRAWCAQCRRSFGNYTDPRDAANAELQHQIGSHPAQLSPAPGTAVGTNNPGGRVSQSKTRLTRDQKRNNFRKPGKRA
jgi:hypothetical protein